MVNLHITLGFLRGLFEWDLLSAGSSLINLALGFRLQNKHQCITQGLAFLHNNLQLDENNQVSGQSHSQVFSVAIIIDSSVDNRRAC